MTSLTVVTSIAAITGIIVGEAEVLLPRAAEVVGTGAVKIGAAETGGVCRIPDFVTLPTDTVRPDIVTGALTFGA